MDTMVRKISTISAFELLWLWLANNDEGLEWSPENVVYLCSKYPGFVDVSYLSNVWKEIKDHE